MDNEQQKDREVEIGTTKTSTSNINTEPTKRDSWGYKFEAADCTKDTQGLRRSVPLKPTLKKTKDKVALTETKPRDLEKKSRTLRPRKPDWQSKSWISHNNLNKSAGQKKGISKKVMLCSTVINNSIVDTP
jgi:hypothetical protein